MIDITETFWQKSFEQFGGMGLIPGPFQFSNLSQLLNNQLFIYLFIYYFFYVKVSVFHFFEIVNKEHLAKNAKFQNAQISLYCHFKFNKIIKRDWS